jgi:hypothetical protein
VLLFKDRRRAPVAKTSSAAWAPGPAQPHQKDARKQAKNCFRCSLSSRNRFPILVDRGGRYKNRKSG